MKVIDVLRLMNEYDYVRIHPTCDLDWCDENPHILEATKVSDLGWLTVEQLSARTVVELGSDRIETVGRDNSCLCIVYH